MKSTLKLCATSVSAPFTKNKCTATSVTVPGQGVYTLSGATVLFDPYPSFSGTVTTPVQYVFLDSTNQLATAKITPTIGERVGLVALDDAQTTPWDTHQTYFPLSNDSASGGAKIVKSTLKLCATSVSAPFTKKKCTATSITVRGEGVYKLANGKVLFDPLPTFTGTVLTPIQYVYMDSAGLLATAKITPTIGERNGLIADDDAQTTPWDTNQTYSPLTNDTASTGATIAESSLKLCALTTSAPYSTSKCSATSVTVAGEGVYTLSGSTVLFDPEPTFTGTVLTPIQYVYLDSAGLFATAKITPTIGERNGLIARNDAQKTPWDTNQTYSPLTNDTASTSATIAESSLKLCELTASPPYSTSNCLATSVTVAGEGVYTLSGTTVLFDPEPTFTGKVRTPIRYVYLDSAGLLATAKITPTIGDRAREQLPETGSDTWLLFAMMLGLLIAAMISMRQIRIRN